MLIVNTGIFSEIAIFFSSFKVISGNKLDLGESKITSLFNLDFMMLITLYDM